MTFLEAKEIFFTGIKGVGISGLALIAKDMGKNVSGSDVAEEFPTDKELAERKIKIINGFSADVIDRKIDLLVYTAAHGGSENPQVRRAEELKIPTLSYGEALGELTKLKTTIVVSGSHGKTTTTAMLAKILSDAKTDPSWLIGGGNLKDFPAHARWTKGEYFIIEGDEYPEDSQKNSRPKFLFLHPRHLIITNVDWDHPDVFENEKKYYNAFKKLIKLMPTKGNLIIWGEGENCRRLAKTSQTKKLKVHFILPEKFWPNLKLNKTFGQHNYLNASFAARMAHELGIGQKEILNSLKNFSGAQRRLEIHHQTKNFIWIDDYAHHPTEIAAAIMAVKKEFAGFRLIALFQSHTFSRTKTFAKEFAKSLALADILMIAPIFASAREKETDFSNQDFFHIIKQAKEDSIYIANAKDVGDWLKKNKTDKDLLLTLGAGKMNDWGKEIVTNL